MTMITLHKAKWHANGTVEEPEMPELVEGEEIDVDPAGIVLLNPTEHDTTWISFSNPHVKSIGVFEDIKTIRKLISKSLKPKR